MVGTWGPVSLGATGVTELTGPRHYPQYNGKKERSMRDIKSYERAMRRLDLEEHIHTVTGTFNESGGYRVNGRALVDARLRTLQAAIYKISAGDTTLPMIITADAQAAHESVVRAMDAAGQMGFVHLSITTRQPDEGAGRG